MTVNFTMTFEKPYMLGLLLKRSDKIFIDRNLENNFTIADEFFFNTTITGGVEERGLRGNQSIHRLNTTTSNKRIEMQFDYRNQNMMLYRRIAQNMYWVLIVLISSQFLLLQWRGVGLQPVWVLIEYL